MRFGSLAVWVCLIVGALAAPVVRGQPVPFTKFRAQEIDKTLEVGYGLVICNMNEDDRPDILVADAKRVIWFENPSWKLHTVVTNADAGIKPDNVAIDVYDIDGDGKLDVALGADWQPANTAGGGSLQWLRQPKEAGGKWEVFKIAESIPTLHRVHFGDLDGDGGAELYVGPLKGKGSTMNKNFMDVGTPLIRYRIPNTPASRDAEWKPEVITDELHVMHNFLPVRGGLWNGILAASYEGVTHVKPGEGADAKWTLTPIGAGDQKNPNASRGSSEIKLGKLRGDVPLMAAIEPFHGNQVVVYTPPGDEKKSSGLWTRTVLDETFVAGHAIWCADFDGDGDDEVVAGWREGPKTGINLYKVARVGAEDGAQVKQAGAADATPPAWQKHPLDEGGIACEDLACYDMNGDGRTDVIACGRATRNVKIYWNEGGGK